MLGGINAELDKAEAEAKKTLELIAQTRAVLNAEKNRNTIPAKRGRPKGSTNKRKYVLSDAARERMREGQRKRWAAVRGQQ